MRPATAVLAVSAILVACELRALGATNWYTGAALQKRLAQPVDILWSDNPLRSALRGVSRAHRVAILIDRRVDPGQELDLQLSGLPLKAALLSIARSRELGISQLGPVVYFGPPRASGRLRTLAALRTEEVRRLPPAIGRKFLQAKRIVWKDFATPRELLSQLDQENHLELVGLERVPHDLWAAADLPALSLVDRLTLIAIQFDLTFEISGQGRHVALVSVPDEIGVVRKYPGGRQPEATAEKYAQLAPDAQIKVLGDEVYVKGLVEDHERLTSPPRPGNSNVATNTAEGFANKRYTLTFKDEPVAVALEQLAAQLKLELRIDYPALQAAGISLQKRISLSVQTVTVDELLRQVTRPAGLAYHRRGYVVEICPAE